MVRPLVDEEVEADAESVADEVVLGAVVAALLEEEACVLRDAEVLEALGVEVLDEEAVLEVDLVVEAVDEDDEADVEEAGVVGRLLRSWAIISALGIGVATLVPSE